MTSRRRRRRVVSFTVLAFWLAAVAATGVAIARPPLTPVTVPAFRARAVDGRAVDVEAMLARGPVLVDFWATWCRPCVSSLPALERAAARWAPRGLSVVGVSIDGPRNFARVRPFAQRLGLTFPIVLDETGELQQRFRITAVPTSVLIAADGRVAWTHTGWLPGDDAALEAALAAEFAKASPDTSR